MIFYFSSTETGIFPKNELPVQPHTSTWYLSLFVSIVFLLAGILKQSWIFLLISTIAFLPIAYYFPGANNAWKYIGLTPLIILSLTVVVWFISKKEIKAAKF